MEQIQQEITTQTDTIKIADINDRKEKAITTIERTKEQLNNSFLFRIKVSNDDTLKLNDGVVNSAGRSVNGMSAVVDSKTAKNELKKIGIDIQSIQDGIEADKNGETRAIMRNQLNSEFKRLYKKFC